MTNRPVLWFAGATILGVIAMAHWAGRYPARVTIINASGSAVANVTLVAANQKIEIGRIENGATKTASLDPGESFELRYDAKSWTSHEKLTPAQAIVLFVNAAGRIEIMKAAPASSGR